MRSLVRKGLSLIGSLVKVVFHLYGAFLGLGRSSELGRLVLGFVAEWAGFLKRF